MSFYESYDENSRLSSRHGSVEFLTTMQYIQKYLKPGVRILEIGAGTGRYSHALAQKGYQVDAVELLEHNIRIFKENTLPHEPISITQGNALDLSGFSSNTYDIIAAVPILRSADNNVSPPSCFLQQVCHLRRQLTQTLPSAPAVKPNRSHFSVFRHICSLPYTKK